jgi:hypothetical protein
VRQTLAALLLFAACAVLSGQPGAPAVRPAVGLAIEVPAGADAKRQQAALETVRSTGATLFALEISWSAAEPRANSYRVAEVVRAARVLRQSGAILHLDLPLVSGLGRDVPADLAQTAFDDSKLSLRLGRLFDALFPALLDFSTLSLGYEAEIYFADRPEELRAFRRLFDGAVAFLREKVPQLLVGVTTMSPSESRAPEVAALLHQRSPVLLYIYAPFERDRPFVHRAPASLEKDWATLLASAAGRPIAFPEVSFSSAEENGSSPQAQADFIHRLRRMLASGDGRKLLFARYVSLRDPPAASLPSLSPRASAEALRKRAFLARRGLQSPEGRPKPAWREWVRAAR